MRKTVLSSLIVAIMLGASPFAKAQENLQPAGIVSISGVQNVLKDFGTLANIAGMGNEALGVTLVASTMSEGMGIDSKRPMGGVLFLSEAGPTGYAFIPITNIDKMIAFAKEKGVPINDEGNGKYSVTGPAGNTVALRVVGGWLFAGKSADDLAKVPADPIPLLAGLEKQYTIAVRENVQAIPAEFRKMMGEQFVTNITSALNNVPTDSPLLKVFKPIIEAQIKEMPKRINETDQNTFGWGVDSANKKTYLDISAIAVAGTDLAKKYAASGNVTTNFAHFLDPKSAGNLHCALALSPQDVQSIQESIAVLRERALKGVDNNNDIPDGEGKKAVKEIVGQLFDVAKDTIGTGKLNDGLVLNIQEKDIALVAGGNVADGPKLEAAIKSLVNLAKNEPDFPGVTFNAESYQGVNFHTTGIPMKDPGGQMVFGPKMDVVIGIGPKSAYLALGKNASLALKNTIDKSASGAGQKVQPLHAAVSIGQLVNFGLQFAPEPNAQAVATEIAKAGDKDHVLVDTKVNGNSVTSRIEVEEGVIRAIGAGIRASWKASRVFPPPQN